MGYRNYIASIPRKEYDKIKNLNREDLYKYKRVDPKEDHIAVYDVAEFRLYELGKYVDVFSKRLFKPVFLDKELQKEFSEEHDFYLVGKKFVEAVIDRYSNNVKSYYNEMLKDILTNEKYPKLKNPKEVSLQSVLKIFNHVKNMSFEWGCTPFSDSPPYNLNNGDQITNSSKYEYNIFELVRIYKTFDWKNNVMIYYGY